MKTFKMETSPVTALKLMFVYALDTETNDIVGVGSYSYATLRLELESKSAYNEAYSAAKARGYRCQSLTSSQETEKNTMPIDEVSSSQHASFETQKLATTNLVEEVDTRSLTEILMTIAPQQRRGGFCLRLYLPSIREPVEVWNQNIITIGRRDVRKSIFPNVDLSNHYGAQLGVSRLHAQISYQSGTFWFSDLNSRNKSWLNGRLLKHGEKLAITHRDTLRLGHFMIQVGACQY